MSLKDLRELHDTDKFNLGYVDIFYDSILSPRKHTTKNILEIGIDGGEGCE